MRLRCCGVPYCEPLQRRRPIRCDDSSDVIIFTRCVTAVVPASIDEATIPSASGVDLVYISSCSRRLIPELAMDGIAHVLCVAEIEFKWECERE